MRVHILHPPPDDALKHLTGSLDPSVCVTAGADSLEHDVEVLVNGRIIHDRSQALGDADRVALFPPGGGG